MVWSHLFRRKPAHRSPRPAVPRLRLEECEARTVPYTVSGNAWPNPQLVTISFVPDGTVVGTSGSTTVTSNLFATFNAKFGSASAWQNIILQSAQAWAQQTNLNFAVVPDDGATLGVGSYQQGDPKHGDIRISGYNFGSSALATTYMPPPANNYDIAGDMKFNTGQNFNKGTTYDLFTVAAHEIGHALGMYHSDTISAELYSAYGGVKTALTTDDINGIRSVYSAGAARSGDRYDSSANGTFATADDLTSAVSSSTDTGVVTGLDITSTGDADYYVIGGGVPTNGGKLTVTVQSKGLSLLAPSLTVYAADQTTVLGSASALGVYGTSVSVTVSGVGQGKPVYIKVDGADNTAMGTGAYALTLNTGTNATPTVPLPNTQRANGSPKTGGGGLAIKNDLETVANGTTAGVQQVGATGQRATAMDANGNFVVVWASQGQDGSGWGVYGRRFNANGTPAGAEFRINGTTAGDQTDPAVAMAADGSFVVTWSSQGQDGSNSWGIYAQRFTASGAKVGGEFRVNATSSGDQTESSVAIDNLGNFYVVWTSSGQDGSGAGVYGRKFPSLLGLLCLPLTGDVKINSTTSGDQRYPQVTVDPLGTAAIVTWSSNGQDGSGWGVYARSLTLGLVPLTGEIRLNQATAGDQIHSTVVADALGNFYATWASNGQDGSGWGVYARRFSLQLGLPLDNEFQVNAYTTGDQQDPKIGLDPLGNPIIVWSSYGQDGSGWGVYGRQFTGGGIALGPDFQANTTTAGDQQHPSVDLDGLGHVVVAWSGNGGPDAANVMFQRFDTSTVDLNAGAVGDTFNPNGDDDDHDHEGHSGAADTDMAVPETAATAAIPASDVGQPGPTSNLVEAVTPVAVSPITTVPVAATVASPVTGSAVVTSQAGESVIASADVTAPTSTPAAVVRVWMTPEAGTTVARTSAESLRPARDLPAADGDAPRGASAAAPLVNLGVIPQAPQSGENGGSSDESSPRNEGRDAGPNPESATPPATPMPEAGRAPSEDAPAPIAVPTAVGDNPTSDETEAGAHGGVRIAQLAPLGLMLGVWWGVQLGEAPRRRSAAGTRLPRHDDPWNDE